MPPFSQRGSRAGSSEPSSEVLGDPFTQVSEHDFRECNRVSIIADQRCPAPSNLGLQSSKLACFSDCSIISTRRPALKLCLHLVSQSFYFIGILGENYGT